MQEDCATKDDSAAPSPAHSEVVSDEPAAESEPEPDEVVDFWHHTVLLAQVQETAIDDDAGTRDHTLVIFRATLDALDQLGRDKREICGLWLCTTGPRGQGSIHVERIEKVLVDSLQETDQPNLFILHGQAGRVWAITDDVIAIVHPTNVRWQSPTASKKTS